MLQHVRAFDSLLAASKNVVEAANYDALLKTQLSQLKQLAQRTQCSSTDCVATMQAISACLHLSSSQKEELSNVIAARLCGESAVDELAAPKTAGAHPQQTHEYMSAYLTAEDWNVLSDNALKNEDRLNKLVDRCLSIVLLYPSELTVKSIVGLLVAANAGSLTPAESHALILTFKSKLKARRNHVSCLFSAPRTYAADAKAFATNCKDAYGEAGLPVDCPIPVDKLRSAVNSIPVRRTNSALAQNTSAEQMQPQRAAGQPQVDSTLQMILQAFAQQLCPRPSADVNLTYNTPRRSNTLQEQRMQLLEQQNSPAATSLETPGLQDGSAPAAVQPKNLQDMISSVRQATVTSKEARALEREQAKAAQPVAVSTPKTKETKKVKESPAKTNLKQIHTVKESKAAWANGQTKLGNKWLQSKERKDLIAAMPKSEKKRRRMIK
jgi:hypothetical protein